MERRTTKGIRNLYFSLGSSFLVLFLSFINRSVFVKHLSSEYLGLNGLFSNLLGFLALAELGVGSAINYALYRPLSKNDTDTVKAIMGLYKKFYVAIGTFILIAGLALTPFLSYLIKDVPDNIPYLALYYMLYVLNSAVSYFYTYKRSLIICDQKEYISYTTTTIQRIVTTILQILILVLSNNYTLYLIASIVCTVGENILISSIANRLYPFLKERKKSEIDKDIQKSIYSNIFALMIHKIGAAVVFSTDNIIISKFVGLHAVGLYSNYTLVVTSINNILGKAFNSITASAGNLIVESNPSHTKDVLYNILFANMWVYGFCSTCLLTLLEPFIGLWLGSDFLLSKDILFVVILNFYITGMRKTIWVFKDAGGIYKQDRIKPIIEALLNVVFSIPLAIKIGVAGVLIGTILSTILFPFWYEARAFFKAQFRTGIREYVEKQVLYFFFWIIVGCVNYTVCSILNQNDLHTFFIVLLVSIVVPNLFVLLFFRKSREFMYYRKIIYSLVSNLKTRIIPGGTKK